MHFLIFLKDEETPNLNVLLCETFVAIYMSLLSYALASCDAQILYRLISQKITPNYWSHIFGGGAKKTMRVETMSVPHPPLSKELSVRFFIFSLLHKSLYRQFFSAFFSE